MFQPMTVFVETFFCARFTLGILVTKERTAILQDTEGKE